MYKNNKAPLILKPPYTVKKRLYTTTTTKPLSQKESECENFHIKIIFSFNSNELIFMKGVLHLPSC